MLFPYAQKREIAERVSRINSKWITALSHLCHMCVCILPNMYSANVWIHKLVDLVAFTFDLFHTIGIGCTIKQPSTEYYLLRNIVYFLYDAKQNALKIWCKYWVRKLCVVSTVISTRFHFPSISTIPFEYFGLPFVGLKRMVNRHVAKIGADIKLQPKLYK